VSSRAASIKAALRASKPRVAAEDFPRSLPDGPLRPDPVTVTRRGARRVLRAHGVKVATRPFRRVDAIGIIPFFEARRGKVSVLEKPGAGRTSRGRMIDERTGHVADLEPIEVEGPGQFIIESKARPVIHGVDAILAQFAAIGTGIRFELSPRGHLVAITETGAMPAELRAAIEAAAPLIEAHMAGSPMECEWCAEPAVTLLYPGRAAACAVHATQEDPASGVEPAA
jgi:hypothetical protein